MHEVFAGGQASQPAFRPRAVVVHVVGVAGFVGPDVASAEDVASVWPIAVSQHWALVLGVDPQTGDGAAVGISGRIGGVSGRGEEQGECKGEHCAGFHGVNVHRAACGNQHEKVPVFAGDCGGLRRRFLSGDVGIGWFSGYLFVFFTPFAFSEERKKGKFGCGRTASAIGVSGRVEERRLPVTLGTASAKQWHTTNGGRAVAVGSRLNDRPAAVANLLVINTSIFQFQTLDPTTRCAGCRRF